MCLIDRFLCFELQTAGVILGWIATAKSFMSLVITAVFYRYIPGYVNETISNFNNISSNITDSDKALIQTSTSICEALAVAIIVLCAVDFIASAMLLYGTLSSRRLFLLPWLMENGFNLLWTGFMFTIVLIALALNWSKIGDGIGTAISLIVALIPFVFSVYCWSAVYSLYTMFSLLDQQRRPLLQGMKTTPIYQTYERV